MPWPMLGFLLLLDPPRLFGRLNLRLHVENRMSVGAG